MKKLFVVAALLLCSLSSFAQRHSRRDNSGKTDAIALLVGGATFTAASILEGSKAYETYLLTPMYNPQDFNTTRKTTPFSKQFPRNIMFTVGISFSVVGVVKLFK